MAENVSTEEEVLAPAPRTSSRNRVPKLMNKPELKPKFFKFKITFVEPILGTQPGSGTPATDHITNKAIKDGADVDDIAEQALTLPQQLEKGTTGFYRDPETGVPIMYGYHVKAMLKNAAGSLNVKGEALEPKVIKQVFVMSRRMDMIGTAGEPLERPLRTTTPQGFTQTALARSEQMLAGTYFEGVIRCIPTKKFTPDFDFLDMLFNYGQFAGMLQWRNSGLYGQFEYELEETTSDTDSE